MKSLADGLPAEIAQLIHPDWRTNEAGYWSVRDQLLSRYEGKWIGFADGKVIASGTRPVVVLNAALDVVEHPFLVCVGRESEPYRMRRATFLYDSSYPGEALPVLSVEFRPTSGVSGLVLKQVVADTGADTSSVPWADCQAMQLNPLHGIPATMSGVAGGSAPTLGFRLWVYLDGQEYLCQLHADFVGNEGILGRDVLNSLEVLFRGPSGEVFVNP